MSELEHCRLAYEGQIDKLQNKIESNQVENLATKKDSSGRSALHWACVGSRKDIVDYLIGTFNVPFDDPDDQGWTPLMISASVGCFDLVKMFLERGCDPNIPNENQQRALHYACSKNRIEIARLLLEFGAQINAVDRYGSSALHRASSKGNMKILDLLLNTKGINVNIADSEGNTPLHLACEEQRIEAAKQLLKHGANPHIKNKNEQTSIDITSGGLLSIIEN